MRLLIAALALTAVGASDAHSVSQKNKAFSQAALTVKPGEDVTFTNDDVVVHNVFSATPGLAFNLKTQPPGTSAHVSFDKEGAVDVRCAIHPTMKLTITVKR
jgi:plastocyanin